MMLFAFTEGLVFSLLSILFVIAIISLIVLAITPLKKLSHPKTKTKSPTKTKETDIKDDDMMAALIVASIDFIETEETEPKLISIKEINHENL